MDSRNSGRFVVAGVAAALLLVVAFGNQWLWEDLLGKDLADDDSASHVLMWLNTPHWIVDRSGPFARFEAADVTGCLVGVAALLGTVAVVLLSATRRRDFNPLISGWFSLVAGGAAYCVSNYLVSGMPGGTGAGASSDDRTLAAGLDVIAAGAGYGLLAGWFVGIVAAFAAAGGGLRTLFAATPAPDGAAWAAAQPTYAPAQPPHTPAPHTPAPYASPRLPVQAPPPAAQPSAPPAAPPSPPAPPRAP
ncbi:hypothetical protein [Yinghuangia sp. YIM S09857]|uniref:hypothetical protein n=1 Tax=Yinghuangia sp. YIM S09857 TaxID=3436929 RepID=UPI003F52DDE3